MVDDFDQDPEIDDAFDAEAAPPEVEYGYTTSEAAPPFEVELLEPQSASPDTEIHPVLVAHLRKLEEWAIANRKDARKDAIAFWSLKIPAILTAASAGVWAHYELTTVSVIAGAIASVCVIVDGIHPRGMLRNTHLRAFHDIRLLSSSMAVDWHSRSGNAKPENVARGIIRKHEAERQRIAAYIRDAETTLNPDRTT